MLKKLNEQGFTLIELLIVVVIIGILASLAIPRFTAVRERAHYSSLRADLRILSTQQGLHYTHPSSAYQYASDHDDELLDWSRSRGVTVVSFTGDGGGWSAVVAHEALGENGCAVYYGDADPVNAPGGATPPAPGVIACDDGAEGG